MSKKKLLLLILLALGGLSLIAFFVRSSTVAVLSPKGTIAQQQYDLIIFTILLSLVIVVPVFALTFYIAWQYRASNTRATYRPDHDHSRAAETVWWLVPLTLISILAVITWVSAHKLDPFRPIASDKKPLTIQVVALEWKWLFLYPEQNIATINYVQFPANTPLRFEITADAPMNSFWIPQLGGQIYAMAGMTTHLQLQATETGTFRGSSANISGEGFAGMKFTAKATSEQDFTTWVESTRKSSKHLGIDEYIELAKPTKNEPVALYASADSSLYDKVIMKYMTPGMQDMGQGSSELEPIEHKHEGMNHY